MKRSWIACAIPFLLGQAVSALSQTPSGRPVIPAPQGDETPLVKVQASARDLVEVPFFAIVGLRIDDYYNFRYDNAQLTHYSLEASEVDTEGKWTGLTLRLYARRGQFDGVINAVIEATKGSRVAKLAHIKAVIKRDRYDPNKALMAELVDVQFKNPDGDTWGKWEVAAPASAPSPRAKDKEPKAEDTNVWWRGGSSLTYHRRTCPLIKDAKELKELTLPEAATKKLKPCSKCNPPAPPRHKEKAQAGESNSRQPISPEQERS